MGRILGADVREGEFCGHDEEGLIVPMRPGPLTPGRTPEIIPALTLDMDGHVTCHCARCEAERAKEEGCHGNER